MPSRPRRGPDVDQGHRERRRLQALVGRAARNQRQGVSLHLEAEPLVEGTFSPLAVVR
jgi:hypothetical protein